MNPSTAIASVLVDELVRGGVREIVLSPGSRSAPLAYAASVAEAEGRLRLHVRVDERSAGFLALGLSKGSGGAPVAVVTTSGTAVANLHPAVLEAHHAGVPLVVVSADRPHELRGTGANQTTHQPGLFRESVRWAVDLPAPDRRAGQVPSWRATVCRALAAATGASGPGGSGRPGPVHLNVCLREPLVPDEDPSADAWPDSLDGRPVGAPWVAVAPRRDVPADPPGHVDRTLVLVGALPDGVDASAVVDWAARQAYPLVAEPFGPRALREAAVRHGSLLLTAAEWVDAHAPERVVVVGRPTLSRAVAALLRRPGLVVEAVVAGGGPWPDPSHVVARVHPWSALAADAPAEPAGAPAPASDWAREWADAGCALAAALGDSPSPWGTGPGVAAVLASALPEDATVVVGSSNPVRDLDLAAAGAVGGRVVANRGLAGIDGLVSTATGVALATGRPTWAVLGDLTFLHDSGGLLVGPDEPRPDLTLVVVNDDGGGIFSTLEPGEPGRATGFERVFGTPTGTDLAALCAAHGIRHALAESATDLARLVARPYEGVSVVEVRTDRATHRDAHADLRARARTALGLG
ncbi:MAG TPA: 2-succinyl-5-enolpyruvyl-6-hydroxy-3-cyclohexene-1-carboxylic-acid synthase [Phycicoccus sp.]|nr:2-succinyl-5-enolpyruvyl-6-hydroxy-3-cyclohexene-1-carboxylic-acid synthase [Phycicoccus sp.]